MGLVAILSVRSLDGTSWGFPNFCPPKSWKVGSWLTTCFLRVAICTNDKSTCPFWDVTWSCKHGYHPEQQTTHLQRPATWHDLAKWTLLQQKIGHKGVVNLLLARRKGWKGMCSATECTAPLRKPNLVPMWQEYVGMGRGKCDWFRHV